jgi:dipeptidyl aminopeptidase/acylaminoacyl peptidase
MDPIRATDYYRIGQVADPQLSPDGETVAFVHTEPTDAESYERNVWTVPADGSATAEPFTTGDGDSEPRFGPDGERLAFVRSEDDDPPQLFVVPTDGGEARQVTDVVGGVGSVAWSPVGDRIAFTQRSTAAEREAGHDIEADEEYEREPPDPRVIDRLVYRADEQFFDGTRSHVYTVTVDDGTVERHTDGDLDFVAPTFGDSTTLYYAVKRGPEPDDSIEYDVDSLDLATGDRETVTATYAVEPTLEATGDGRVVYPYVDPDRPTLRRVEIEVYDTEADEAVSPTDGVDRTAGAFTLDGESICFLTPDEGKVTVRRAPLAGTEPEDVETVVAEGHATGVDARDGRVVVAKSEWDHRGDVFLAAEDTERRLTTVNADYLDDRRIAEPEAIRFENDDGDEIQGWVLTPPEYDSGGDADPADGTADSHPLVVQVHGGPHIMWSRSDTMWHEFQTLAARGYAVFWCNPRGSSGYGESFMAANQRDWGPVTTADVLAGADRVAARDDVDETRQFVTGGSFGGFMVAWLVAHTDRFDAAVAQRGVYELTGFYGTSDAYLLVESDFDATPWTDHGFFWSAGPAAHAEAIETPTLVMHAENDHRVPVSNAELFYRFLRKEGVDSRFVRYPREGHELSRSGEPGHVVDRLERIARWFDGYSTHHDVPPALERGAAGLSGTEDTRADEEPTD